MNLEEFSGITPNLLIYLPKFNGRGPLSLNLITDFLPQLSENVQKCALASSKNPKRAFSNKLFGFVDSEAINVP